MVATSLVGARRALDLVLTGRTLTAQRAYRAGLVDEIVLYQAPCLLGEDGRPGFVIGALGRMEDRPEFEILERVAVGSDLRMRLAPPYREV